MKFIIPIFLFLTISLSAQKMDSSSLKKMSLDELFIKYSTLNNPEEQLTVALEMLSKGEAELDTKDTAYAKILYYVGSGFKKISDYANATLYLKKANEIWDSKKVIDYNLFNCLLELGFVYYYQNLYGETEMYWLKATSISKKLFGEYNIIYSDCLWGLAYVNEKLNNNTNAEQYYLEIIKIKKKILVEKNPDYAHSLYNLANLYFKMGYYDKSEPLYQEALKIQKEILGEKNPDYCNTLNNLALIYKSKGNYKKAESLYLEVLTLDKILLGDKHPRYATTLNNLAQLYQEIGNYSKAEPLFISSLEIVEEVGGKNHPDNIETLNNLAGLYVNLSKYREAEKLYQKAIAILKDNNRIQNPLYATTLNNFGLLYVETGDFMEAEQFYLEAIRVQKAVYGEQHPKYATYLNNLGSLYIKMGMYEKVEQFYNESSLNIKKVLGDQHITYATILNNNALFYYNIGKYDKAEQLYLEVLNIQKKTIGEQHPSYASILNNLGQLYKELGKYKMAESTIITSLQIKKNIIGEQHPGYASTLNNLANIYCDLGNYSIAEQLYLKALKIEKEKLGEYHPSYLNTLSNLTLLYSKFDNTSKVKFLNDFLLESKKEVLGEDHPNYAISLNNAASFYSDIGEYENALNLYNKALRIEKEKLGELHPSYLNTLGNLGNLHMILGDYEEAKIKFNEVTTIGRNVLGENHPSYCLKINNLAYLYENMGDYIKADSLYNQNFRVRKNTLSNTFTWLSEKEKTAFWQKEKSFFDGKNHFASIASSQLPKSVELAYNVNLLTKGLLLETSMEIEEAVYEKKDSASIFVFEDLREKRRLINHLISSGIGKKEIIDKYEIEADSLDKILVNSLGEYATAKQKFEISWKDVQNNITSEEAAIEFAQYYDVKDCLYKFMALVLRTDYEYPKLIKLGTEKEIQSAVNNKDFQNLYSIVWEGLDSLLDGVKTVYYSPSGELNNVAFSALCYQSSDTTQKVSASKNTAQRSTNVVIESEDGQSCSNYLIDKYNLHQLSSTRYLADGTLNKDKAMNLSIQLLGAINYDAIPEQKNLEEKEQTNEDFVLEINLNKQIERGKNKKDRDIDRKMAYLPGTKAEVYNVSKLLKNNNWKVAVKTEKDAGEYELKKNLIASNPGVLHIATHGFAFPDEDQKVNYQIKYDRKSNYKISDNPMVRCGLMLSGSNISWTGNPQKMIAETGDDGILTAAEVSNLNLSKTKLVVLSACQTGLGKIEGSEGTFGLKRGFKLAGVEQLIVSLWSVPDKETMELMTTFYDDLTKTKNPVISFEKAQKEMRHKYPTEPLKWAGFVLVR